MSISIRLLVIVLATVYFTGCATVLTGYEDTVMIYHLPPDAKVFDTNGRELPVKTRTERRKQTVVVEKAVTVKDTTVIKKVFTVVDSVFDVSRYITLRSNVEHEVTVRFGDNEKKFYRYPKLSAGWFLLDVITGTFFVDWYTGNWNHFDDINFKSE